MKNKDIVLRFIETVWNNGEFEKVADFIDPRYQAHALGSGRTVRGIDGVLKNARAVHAEYINFHVSVDSMVEEGDKVISRMTLSGTKDSRQHSLVEFIEHHLEGGKIIEAWSLGSSWRSTESSTEK